VISTALLMTQTVVGIESLYENYTPKEFFFILVTWSILALLGNDFKIGRSSGYEKSVTKSLKTITVFLATFSFFIIFSNQEAVSRNFFCIFQGYYSYLFQLNG
jgi:hypothetical protein